MRPHQRRPLEGCRGKLLGDSQRQHRLLPTSRLAQAHPNRHLRLPKHLEKRPECAGPGIARHRETRERAAMDQRARRIACHQSDQPHLAFGQRRDAPENRGQITAKELRKPLGCGIAAHFLQQRF